METWSFFVNFVSLEKSRVIATVCQKAVGKQKYSTRKTFQISSASATAILCSSFHPPPILVSGRASNQDSPFPKPRRDGRTDEEREKEEEPRMINWRFGAPADRKELSQAHPLPPPFPIMVAVAVEKGGKEEDSLHSSVLAHGSSRDRPKHAYPIEAFLL